MATQDQALSDAAIMAELGSRLSARRLARNTTQAALAKEAGVSKRTLERIEAGHSAQLTSFIRVLRALDLVDALQAAIPPARPGPMDLLKNAGQPPQRASGKADASGREWTWGIDE